MKSTSPAYKQEESPRYHARDLAVVRAKMEGCVVLLASATPCLESFSNAITGKYELLRMTRRTDGKSLPLIRVVDLRLERRKGSDSPDTRVLSEKLRSAIQKRLDKGEQTILFLNRARLQHIPLGASLAAMCVSARTARFP